MRNGRRTEIIQAAKKAWMRIQSDEPSFFPFDMLGEGSDRFLETFIPSKCRVLLLGGGSGKIVQGIEKKERTFLNMDIRKREKVKKPVVEPFRGDMEERIERAVVVPEGVELCVITPFSLEYTDTFLSSTNIANLLLKGEKWLWLCHHTDSRIVGNFRIAHKLREIVEDKKLKSVKKMLATTPEELREELKAELSALPKTRSEERKIEYLRRRIRLNAELSGVLIGREISTPADLTRFVDFRLRLIAGEIWNVEADMMMFGRQETLAVCGVFEKE